MTIIRVALDVPVDSLFDYRAENVTAEDVGRRVEVPFGRRRTVGVILEISGETDIPEARLKSALRVLRDLPPISEADLQLLRFAADYYRHPLGAVVMGTLPTRLRRPPGRETTRVRGTYHLTSRGRELGEGALPARARVQLKLLERLKSGPLATAEARALSPRATAVLKQFVTSGWATLDPADAASAAQPGASVPAPALTAEQAEAAARIRSQLGAYRCFLLFGVTGSGKTEVYLDAMAATLGAGKQALLLVPEISLTPQLEGLLARRFPETAAVSLHSGLTETERLQRWREAQAGKARIVLGTRLAVFAPMPELGLIVVDEEQDASFKQAEGFRYSARDIAVARAHQRGVPVVLGSATPALETYHNAVSGRYELLVLRHRIGAPPPHIACIDTRGEKLADGVSQRALDAIQERLAGGDQCLVFINRRGYAPVLLCRACGWMSGCDRCAAQRVLHLEEKRLRCHHCGQVSPVPVACPGCGNPDLAPVGQGTQRVEAALAQRLQGARVLRIDRDTTGRRQAWQSMRKRIENREVDVLVGTQILAKGHDFPSLNLVVVLNADSHLYSTDFRAAEHLYALLTQVAGRSGRGGTQGQVLIQTEFPDHPLYEALRHQDYRAYAESALAERRQAGFPPFVHQALLRAEATRLDAALAFLGEAARRGRDLDPEITLYDPVPAALHRRAGRERAQLLIQSPSRARLQEFLRRWRSRLESRQPARARWSLDVDPLEF